MPTQSNPSRGPTLSCTKNLLAQRVQGLAPNPGAPLLTLSCTKAQTFAPAAFHCIALVLHHSRPTAIATIFWVPKPHDQTNLTQAQNVHGSRRHAHTDACASLQYKQQNQPRTVLQTAQLTLCIHTSHSLMAALPKTLVNVPPRFCFKA